METIRNDDGHADGPLRKLQKVYDMQKAYEARVRERAPGTPLTMQDIMDLIEIWPGSAEILARVDNTSPSTDMLEISLAHQLGALQQAFHDGK